MGFLCKLRKAIVPAILRFAKSRVRSINYLFNLCIRLLNAVMFNSTVTFRLLDLSIVEEGFGIK